MQQGCVYAYPFFFAVSAIDSFRDQDDDGRGETGIHGKLNFFVTSCSYSQQQFALLFGLTIIKLGHRATSQHSYLAGWKSNY